jgi:hypothetical protein
VLGRVREFDLLADDGDGAGCVVQDTLADGAQAHPPHSAEPAAPDHGQLRFLRFL